MLLVFSLPGGCPFRSIAGGHCFLCAGRHPRVSRAFLRKRCGAERLKFVLGRWDEREAQHFGEAGEESGVCLSRQSGYTPIARRRVCLDEFPKRKERKHTAGTLVQRQRLPAPVGSRRLTQPCTSSSYSSPALFTSAKQRRTFRVTHAPDSSRARRRIRGRHLFFWEPAVVYTERLWCSNAKLESASSTPDHGGPISMGAKCKSCLCT